MDFFDTLIGIFVLVICLLSWVNRTRLAALEHDVAELRTMLCGHKNVPTGTTSEQPPVSDSIKNVPVQIQLVDDDFNWDEEQPSKVLDNARVNKIDVPRVEHTASQKSLSELNIGAKLPVWIGAISLACAGFYLVKYSIDSGLLGPATRVVLGLLFGLVMVGAGRIIFDRPHIANSLRMAQGIVGAGLVTLTLSLYSAVHLYHLILPVTGFIGMAAIVVATMVLAIRLGQPVAIFGLVGGLLAPALFSTGEPNMVGLFAYLFVLYAGLQFVMLRQKWLTLSVCTLAGVLFWALLVISDNFFIQNSSVLAVFVLSILAVTIFSSHKNVMGDADVKDENTNNYNMLNMLALGGSTFLLLILQNRIQLNIFDWGITSLLSLATVGLTYFQPATYTRAMWGKLASDLLLLGLYLPHATMIEAGTVIALLAGIYAAIPAYIMLRDGRAPCNWAITQVAAGIGLYLVAYIQLPIPEIAQVNLIWGLMASLCAAYAVTQVLVWRKAEDDFIVALYAMAATSFISLGLSIVLPKAYLPTAFAFETAALYWIYRSVAIQFLQTIAKILLGVTAFFSLKLIAQFAGIILSSVFSEPRNMFPELSDPTSIFVNYLPPAIGMAIAYVLYRRQDIQEKYMVQLLFAAAFLPFLGAIYISIHNVQTMLLFGKIETENFMGREVVTLMLALIGFILYRRSKESFWTHLSIWGQGLIAVAIARNVYFDLLMYTPILHGGQHVGDIPLLNGVTLTYGGAIILVLYAMQKRMFVQQIDVLPKIYRIMTLVFVFTLTSLNVRQFFHGTNLETGKMMNAELYSYSVVWLMTGLGLLAYGMKRADKALRLAALVFLTLTIAKVFLVDASELEGLYRIFSFLGLGVSLIGLSMFYTRFMARSGNGGH